MRIFKKPVLCYYYVTFRCNATCSFCDIWERPSPYVTLENAAENLRDLAKLGVKVVDFTGGEPLLHRQIAELLEIAKSFGFITLGRLTEGFFQTIIGFERKRSISFKAARTLKAFLPFQRRAQPALAI